MGLAAFVADYADGEATLTVVDRESERPVYRLLSRFFGDAVTLREVETVDAAGPTDAVVLERDGETLAGTSLAAIRDELLLVNSDVYVTGSRPIEDVETPSVVTGLAGVPYEATVRADYPREKLLMIEVSRYVEAMAWRAGEGRLATGFQSLSRIEDERGTRRVYERIGDETDVDAHVYGLPGEASLPSGVTAHAVDTDEIRRSWFVCYRSGAHPHEAAAQLAVKTAPDTWEGVWTFDPDRVGRVLDYLDRTYD
jgi:hypothetical protein